MAASEPGPSVSIWAFAFGYFACYVPYSALTKALSSGALSSTPTPIAGVTLLPLTALSSLLGMFVFISAMRWWRFASSSTVFGVNLPRPTRWTLLSGLCTAGIIATTTLSYTFEGISIVFMMLLMRGGVLVIAPLVDFASGRKVGVYSWVGLALSMGALLVAHFGSGPDSTKLTVVAAVDVGLYLLAYFVRLRFMSRLAKSADADVTRRYFVEEQMTATPLVITFLALVAWLGRGDFASALRAGFVDMWQHPALWLVLLVGLLSQGTGIFGGLILLDRRENTFCVPVNRASSILAGVCASFALVWLLGVAAPAASELWGALLVVAAIVVLSAGSLKKAWAAGKS